MKLIGVHHGHPEDLPHDVLSHGWDCYRFNGLFGPWREPTDRAAQILRDLYAATGIPSLVVLLHANTYGLGITSPINGKAAMTPPAFAQACINGAINAEVVAARAMDWLQQEGLQDAVLLDIGNGPERWWDTTYPGLPRTFGVDTAYIKDEAATRGLRILSDDVVRRHFYLHRSKSARDYWERSETYTPGEPHAIWYTEVGIHATVPDQADALRWLLTVGTWDADRVYVHAPYQQNDGAGYGGLWHNPETRAVLQSHPRPSISTPSGQSGEQATGEAIL